jgi:ketosteroid isomerase-like protein
MRSDAEGVRAANQRFYEAVSRQSLVDLEQIWSHAAHVRCVHPGARLLEGWDAIRASWREIFGGAICLTAVPHDPQVALLGSIAIVVCREEITSITRSGSLQGMRLSTNVFERRDGRWQLIHYHASPLQAGEAPGTA